jgi:hypothetical protein
VIAASADWRAANIQVYPVAGGIVPVKMNRDSGAQ